MLQANFKRFANRLEIDEYNAYQNMMVINGAMRERKSSHLFH